MRVKNTHIRVNGQSVKYDINSIVPSSVAREHLKELQNNNIDITSQEFYDRVMNSNLWSKRRSHKNIGQKLNFGCFRLMVNNAFGKDISIIKSSRISPYLWRNTKTKFRSRSLYYLSPFELYVLQREYIIHFSNTLEINACDGGVYKRVKGGKVEKYIDGKLVKVMSPIRIKY